MKNENQQREVSSCCGAEVEQTECFCPGSTDLKHDQLICKKCEKRCDSKPQDHIVEADKAEFCTNNRIYHVVDTDSSGKIVSTICIHCGKDSKISDLILVQRTPEETRQTGSEGWEKEAGYLQDLIDVVLETDILDTEDVRYFYEADRIINGSKVDNAWKTLRKDFIRDLLAAQREEMEKRNIQLEMERDAYKKRAEAQEEKNFILKSEIVRTEKEIVVDSDINSDPFFDRVNKRLKEERNKQIIEAVELVEKMVKEASQSFIDVSNRMQDPSFPLHYMDVVVAKEILEKLAQFKREYGGKE